MYLFIHYLSLSLYLQSIFYNKTRFVVGIIKVSFYNGVHRIFNFGKKERNIIPFFFFNQNIYHYLHITVILSVNVSSVKILYNIDCSRKK